MMKYPHPFQRFPLSVLMGGCLLAIACDRPEPLTQIPRESQSVASHANEVSVVDRLNRTVVLSRTPKRIISLAPATTELLFAIGAGDLLVGATDHCNYPPAASRIARIGGGTMQGISHETILSLSPDLILSKWDTHQPLIESFDRIRVPMLAIGPDSLAQLYEDAKLLGRVTGHEREADEWIVHMQRRVEVLTRWIDSFPREKRRRVFYEVWDEPLMTAGPKSFIGELLELGGMENVFSDTTVAYPRISDEVVLDRNPEVIFAPSTHQQRVSLDILCNRQGWDRILAVQNRQVFLIDGDKISRCGPRMLEALEEMIRYVYPDKLAEAYSDEVTVH